MSERYDLAVIGCGPAGMATAVTAGEHGLSVIVLDEQSSPGGQIYRGIERSPVGDRDVLGEDYSAGAALVERFRASNTRYVPSASVWQVSSEREIAYSSGGKSYLINADHIVLATGAMERPFPVPGWTLPGVMTAGAAQIMLKTSAMLADDAVFAGAGPLLYLIVAQYLRAGARVRAVLDTTPRAHYRRAARLPMQALAGQRYVRKGLHLKREIRKSGTTFVADVDSLRLAGAGHVRTIEYRRNGIRHSIETDQVFLHQGVIPNVNLTMATGCKHGWDTRQLCWKPHADDWGCTSTDGIAVTGDGSGIRGAIAAELSGNLVALEIARKAQRLAREERDCIASPLQARLARETRFRVFLDTLYRPADALRIPSGDDVIVCRCEEVNAGEIRSAIKLGCSGPNQLKAFTRCGMGPCQGRLCGTTVCELIAAVRGVAVGEVGYYRVRTPAKPVTLGELANLGFVAGSAAPPPT